MVRNCGLLRRPEPSPRGPQVRIPASQPPLPTTGRSKPDNSWRSKLSPTGPNRRFYLSSGEYWSLPLKTAVSLLDELASKGGLDEQYFDRRRPGFSAENPLVSDNMTSAEKADWEARIFAEEED